MKYLIMFLFLFSAPSYCAMSATSCETKISAAIAAATGQAPATPNLIKAICEGIIDEITSNGVVNASGPGGSVTGTVE